MKKYNTAAIKASLTAVKADYPDLHGLLVDIADELEDSFIDTESTFAAPASVLINALNG